MLLRAKKMSKSYILEFYRIPMLVWVAFFINHFKSFESALYSVKYKTKA